MAEEEDLELDLEDTDDDADDADEDEAPAKKSKKAKKAKKERVKKEPSPRRAEIEKRKADVKAFIKSMGKDGATAQEIATAVGDIDAESDATQVKEACRLIRQVARAVVDAEGWSRSVRRDKNVLYQAIPAEEGAALAKNAAESKKKEKAVKAKVEKKPKKSKKSKVEDEDLEDEDEDLDLSDDDDEDDED